MAIRYTSHAVERMMQRGISPREVEILLSDPDGSIKQSRDKVIAFKQVRGRKDNSLAVVAVDKGNGLLEVVTVMTNFEVLK
ncbi:MAG: DUF4258 domain-containing protein [Pseudomonadales bacterium]|mgnify:CR=1 FL=1|nr:DUF4258 domain-containing protein [Pseudomonadales bacterium]MDP7598129.1 DUF4258 domain-containing protein [Pseudomonadales bacterium]HJN49374.1 DUF4258 domain-containing protein [Pseudomonadales bacterium]